MSLEEIHEYTRNVPGRSDPGFIPNELINFLAYLDGYKTEAVTKSLIQILGHWEKPFREFITDKGHSDKFLQQTPKDFYANINSRVEESLKERIDSIGDMSNIQKVKFYKGPLAKLYSKLLEEGYSVKDFK